MKKLIRYIIIFFNLLIPLTFLSGCTSTDEVGSSTAKIIDEPTCTYQSSSHTTRVTFSIYVSNNSIYNIDEEYFKFDLYNDNSKVITRKYTFSIHIKANSSSTNNCYFDYNGEIDSIKFISWSCDYVSFWDTYSIWMISTIVVASILAVIYILAMIIADFDLDDVFDMIGDHIGIAFTALIPFIIYIITSLIESVWNWVPFVIILGGVAAFILVCLIAHGIKNLIEDITFGSYDYYQSPNKNNCEIYDCLDDEEALDSFTKSELIEFCKENDISGYSGLNKENLITHLMNISDIIRANNVSNNIQNNNNISNINETKNKEQSVNKTLKPKIKKVITFDDIAGLNEAKNAFNEKVILPFEHPEIYKKYNKKVGGGILLYGLPGTGKTMFAEEASNALDALFIPIKCSDIKSKWYGESEQNIKAIFNKARKQKKP